jgi:hypothetical protein
MSCILICQLRTYCPNSNNSAPIFLKKSKISFHFLQLILCGPDSSVGIATDYGLDGRGIESRWGARFFAHVQTDPEAPPDSCIMGTGSFPGVKQPGCGDDYPPPFSAEVKERV